MNDARPPHFPRCRHTGVTIPECCCRHCCEAQLRRYAPWLLEAGRPKADPKPAEDDSARRPSARRSQPVEHCLSEELGEQASLASLAAC